jgi:hypothetical protein
LGWMSNGWGFWRKIQKCIPRKWLKSDDGSGAPKIWIRCTQNMDQVHPKYGSGALKIWIRCTQNSLTKLECAEVSMQLRGLVLMMLTAQIWCCMN